MQQTASIDLLVKDVVGLAMKVHRTLGRGFEEAVYVISICIEFAKVQIPFDHEKPLSVFHNGHVVGDYVTSLIVDGRLIVECKAIQALPTIESIQLFNYLAATGLDS